MFVLAVLAVAACSASRQGVLPRRGEVVGWVLGVAIAVSGVGYLFVSTVLAPMAFVSPTLLLVWVAILGTALGCRP
jgi:hypothetical protein